MQGAGSRRHSGGAAGSPSGGPPRVSPSAGRTALARDKARPSGQRAGEGGAVLQHQVGQRMADLFDPEHETVRGPFVQAKPFVFEAKHETGLAQAGLQIKPPFLFSIPTSSPPSRFFCCL